MKNIIDINGTSLRFEANSLPTRQALKVIRALSHAYMKSLRITSSPYVPTEQTDAARYVTACQLVHDNLLLVEDSQEIRNECLLPLRA